MNPVTPAQFLWILAVCGIVLLVAALAWWRPWRMPAPCCDGSGFIPADRGTRLLCPTHAPPRAGGVVGLEDPTEDPTGDLDLMGVAELVDVDPAPTYPAPTEPAACPHCAEPVATGSDGHFSAYCRVTRAIEPFHNCCPSGCELGPATAPEPQPCGMVWSDEAAACHRPGSHTCVLIGGHRIHRCVCGASVQRGFEGDLSDPAPTQIDPPTVRPYVMGGWVMVGKTKVHRGCAEARRDGRQICSHCAPFLVGSASRSVQS